MLAVREKQVPQALRAGFDFELFDDRRHLPPRRLSVQLFYKGLLVGIDVGVHKGAEAFEIRLGLCRVLEVHRESLRCAVSGVSAGP